MEDLRQELGERLQAGDAPEKAEGVRAFETFVKQEGLEDEFARLKEFADRAGLTWSYHRGWLGAVDGLCHKQERMEGIDEFWDRWTRLVERFDAWLDCDLSELAWFPDPGLMGLVSRWEEAGLLEEEMAEQAREWIPEYVPDPLIRALDDEKPRVLREEA